VDSELYQRERAGVASREWITKGLAAVAITALIGFGALSLFPSEA
jgi:hypothetical protein